MSENEISEISGADFEDSGSEYTPSDKENQRNRHRSRKKLVIPESSDESSVEEANDGISSIEVAEDDSVCKSQKRKRNVWNWKKEKAKRARAFGQAYLNVKGSSVPAKIFNSEDCVSDGRLTRVLRNKTNPDSETTAPIDKRGTASAHNKTSEEQIKKTKDDKAKCDLCNSLYSIKGGSTTNLKKHLLKKHRSTYETIIPCSVSDAAVLKASIPSTSSNTETTNPEQLRPNQKPLKLKMDVVTRWNSTLDMIERICSLQEPLEAALGILHSPVENLSEGEWQTLPEVIKILKPFKQLTEEISSEKKVTVSMVLASTESIIRVFDNLGTNIITEIGKKLANKIITEFKSRFKNCYRHPVLSKAALLDPRFKKLAFRFDASSYESAKDALKTELQNQLNLHKQQSIEPNENESTLAPSTGDTDTDNDSLWKEFDALTSSASASNSTVSSSIITMRQYLEERIIHRNECPLKWWQKREILYPELSNLAEKYLSVMATSVSSERTFSKSGQILSEKRSSIKPKRMEKVLFLNMNQRFLDKE
ncbi:unnamed protein product, partial [Brenthis ino]